MRIPALLCVLALGASPALAEVPEVSTVSTPTPPTTATPAPVTPMPRTTIPVAVAVNVPLRWEDADSVAASLYVGLTKHHAIRANVASYANHGNPTLDLISGVLAGVGSEGSHRGRTTDIGISYVDYPRELWSGFTYELGLLRRARDISVEDQFASPNVVQTKTTTYAGRLMIGWSWLMFRRVFVSFAVGASFGYERGTETTERFIGEMQTTTDVSRPTYAGEGYLRIGCAFGL